VGSVAESTAAADDVAESALLTDALSLWRDVPLPDVPSLPLRRDEVAGLVECHLRAPDRRIELDLARRRARSGFPPPAKSRISDLVAPLQVLDSHGVCPRMADFRAGIGASGPL
jgi:hypothetical protein